MGVLAAQRAEVVADPHPQQLDGRLVVTLDGQAEHAGDPASVLELVGDGRELRAEDREGEVLAAGVARAMAGRLRGFDGALEIVDLGPRQLEPPAIRGFEALSGPGERDRRVCGGPSRSPISRARRGCPCRLWPESRPDSRREAGAGHSAHDHQGQRSPRLNVMASNGRMPTGSSSFALGNQQPLPVVELERLEGMAEREGFEPSVRYQRTHTFQACSLNRSDTSPGGAQDYVRRRVSAIATVTERSGGRSSPDPRRSPRHRGGRGPSRPA